MLYVGNSIVKFSFGHIFFTKPVYVNAIENTIAVTGSVNSVAMSNKGIFKKPYDYQITMMFFDVA